MCGHIFCLQLLCVPTLTHVFRLQCRIICGAYHVRSYIGEDSSDDEEDVDDTDDKANVEDVDGENGGHW